MRLLVRVLVVVGLLASTLTPAMPAAAAAAPEDATLQGQVLDDAYNLLLDHYVQPLDSAALLNAGWQELSREAAAASVAPPGPPPVLNGDRAADLDATRAALADYVQGAGGDAHGLVPVHAVVRGMVHFVSEGHTYFLDAQQFQDYQAWSRGDNRYVGIGISLSARGTAPRITQVYDGTPAQQAGLQPGDTLLAINGRAVGDTPLGQLTGLIRGPAGSTVELVVQRGGEPTPRTVSVSRAEIQVQFVTQRLVGDIGYISLRGFPETSVVQTIEQDVAAFERQGVHGLVLDLRGNAGGRIDVGTRLLGDFLPFGTSVYEEVDRDGRNQTHLTRGTRQFDLPLAVLVDGGTASMGEIFASAVHEHGAATLIGQNTAGSVAAAQIFPLPDGSALQVTVFNILSADGAQLNRVGVTPDEVVDPTTASDPTAGADPALSRAVALLHAGSGAAQPDAPAGNSPVLGARNA